MKINQPGVYLGVDPLRLLMAVLDGDELKIAEYPLSNDAAAGLAMGLLAQVKLNELSEAALAQQLDADFLRKAGVSLQ